MDDCPDGSMRDMLPDLLHRRLAAAEHGAVESHVADCADCRAELALLTGLRDGIHRAPSVDVRAVVAALPPYRAQARTSWGGWRAAAAIAAVTIGGTSVAIARRDAGDPNGFAIVATPAERPAPSVALRSALPSGLPSVTTIVTPSGAPPEPLTAPPSRRTGGELAVSGSVSELSDGELATLLGEIESLDVLPSADVDPATVVPGAGRTSPKGTL